MLAQEMQHMIIPRHSSGPANTILAGRTNTGISLVAVGWILFTISALVVGMRLWARISKFNRVGSDDYLMFISLVCCVWHIILVTVAFTYGMGVHAYQLSPHNLQEATKYIVACEAFAVITCLFGRLSFCVSFLRILGPTYKIQRIVIWAIIVSQIIGNIIVVAQIYAQCGKDLSALWDPAVAAKAHCQNPNIETIFGYVQGILNCISDFLLTLLPGYLVWHLQIPLRTKFALSTVLMLSIFALAASVLKCIAIGNLSSQEDFTYNMVTLEMWCAVENNVIIITASMPALRALFNKKTESSSIATPGAHGTYQTKTGAGSSEKEPDVEMQNLCAKTGLEHTFSGSGSEKTGKYADIQAMEPIAVTKTTRVQVTYEHNGVPEELRKFTSKW